ncbi:hypothetical protein GO013_06185 [Pseudodesulfovibrio sp. JC047]|uniref:hypothetical protein n=1 Tax=Pseudodesulfovibrio sp. JC047 TaxID=2683199 RepID=UPI0013D74FD5|nr:hypothetical protein [Pseudodesulfovibrio sp. JC047]NDV19006.1 hypothetical protein [Pseudodesulfovibrio sp. JC047]
MTSFYRCFTVVLVCLFGLAGCFGSVADQTGLNPAERIEIDDDYATEVVVDRGDVLAVDLASPLGKGYRISAASFDPSMIRMERFLEYTEGEERRVRYLFTVLMDGTSDILIKMRPIDGGAEEVFRQVTVKTNAQDGLF